MRYPCRVRSLVGPANKTDAKSGWQSLARATDTSRPKLNKGWQDAWVRDDGGITKERLPVALRLLILLILEDLIKQSGTLI